SNMEFPLSFSIGSADVIANSHNPMIRLFTVPKRPALGPVSDVQGKWEECNPQTVASFSAVAYYFGRDLRKASRVPVGLIHTSWGGTPAEAWTSKGALEAEPT